MNSTQRDNDDDDDDDSEVVRLTSATSAASTTTTNATSNNNTNNKQRWMILGLIVFVCIISYQLEWIELTNVVVEDDDNKNGTTVISSGKTTIKTSTGVGTKKNTKNKNPKDPQTQAQQTQQSKRDYIYHKRSRRRKHGQQHLSPSWLLSYADSNRQSYESNFYTNYVNRDVPIDEFPINTWQRNSTYISLFLNSSIHLINRSMEAIYSEYGKVSPTAASDRSMFELAYYKHFASSPIYDQSNSGYTTYSSWEGLKRRLLHCIYTEDMWVVVVGGHSAVAGHGNHYQQSYILQTQRILEPIFSRLGSKMTCRNIANGGLGTIQSTLGYHSIYTAGNDIDLLLWDCGMTEKQLKFIDFFARQSLLTLPSFATSSSKSTSTTSTSTSSPKISAKVPVLWNLHTTIIQNLHDNYLDATNNNGHIVDVGYLSTGSRGIPRASSVEEIKVMPYAMRYMKCSSELEQSICKQHQYNGTCFVKGIENTTYEYNYNKHITNVTYRLQSNSDGDTLVKYNINRPYEKVEYPGDNNVIQVKTQRKDGPGGREKWHPGHKHHQLKGRIITMIILQALQEVFVEWQQYHNEQLRRQLQLRDVKNDEKSDDPSSFNILLPTSKWHVTSHYSKVQRALQQDYGNLLAQQQKEENDYLDDTNSNTNNNRLIPCHEMIGQVGGMQNKVPIRICHVPMRGRTEYTPRAYPNKTSILSIMPIEMRNVFVSQQQDDNDVPLYESYEEPYNPILDPPIESDIDVLSIVESGVVSSSTSDDSASFAPILNPSASYTYNSLDIDNEVASMYPIINNRDGNIIIRPATAGVKLVTVPGGSQYCDGSYTSFCHRAKSNDCIMSGQNDYRGYIQLTFDMNGYILLNIPNIRNGILLLKLDLIYDTRTRRRNAAATNDDDDDKEEDKWCDDFVFEYIFNGGEERSILNKTEFFHTRLKKLQRVVQVITLLDDPNYSDKAKNNKNDDNKNVLQVAIRISGCAATDDSDAAKAGGSNSGIGLSLSHVYWS